MSKARDLALIGVYTALLIGGQFALHAISGVEIVTLLAFVFAFCFGIRRGILVAVAFSLLRCLVFGFFPPVLILYLIYYPLFMTIFGALGNRYWHELNPKRHVLVIFIAVLMTIFFSLLDGLITPLYYGFGKTEWKAYLVTSLYTAVPQILSVILSMAIGGRVILKALRGLRN